METDGIYGQQRSYLDHSLLAREINWMETIIRERMGKEIYYSLLAREINWMETMTHNVDTVYRLGFYKTLYSLEKLIEWKLKKGNHLSHVFMSHSLLAREINWMETVEDDFIFNEATISLLAREINWMETPGMVWAR